MGVGTGEFTGHVKIRIDIVLFSGADCFDLFFFFCFYVVVCGGGGGFERDKGGRNGGFNLLRWDYFTSRTWWQGSLRGCKDRWPRSGRIEY